MPLILLFVSSYAPLWLMLAIRFQTWELRAACIALSVVGFGVAAIVLLRNRSEREEDEELVISGDAGADVGGYLAGYLLPFLTVEEPKPMTVVAYVVFLAVAAAIWCRSGLVHVNPTFYVLQRRVLSARQDIGDGLHKEVFVITHKEGWPVGKAIKGRQLADQVWIDHTKP